MARYGATPSAWFHFSDKLGLTDHLLPIVANPNARIAERSTMKAVGKTPSVYDAHREVVGLGKWTDRTSTTADVERWSRETDYAISIQCRAIRAIDIDVEDTDHARRIEQAITCALQGLVLPSDTEKDQVSAFLHFATPDRCQNELCRAWGVWSNFSVTVSSSLDPGSIQRVCPTCGTAKPAFPNPSPR